MRTGITFDLDNAAEQIENALRPFTKPQRAVIANIAGLMLDAGEENTEDLREAEKFQAQSAALKAR
jgi:hypothetical protein